MLLLCVQKLCCVTTQNRLIAIYWCTDSQRAAYKLYHDVVTFDVTHNKNNKYVILHIDLLLIHHPTP